jgi:hypothetical protein
MEPDRSNPRAVIQVIPEGATGVFSYFAYKASYFAYKASCVRVKTLVAS